MNALDYAILHNVYTLFTSKIKLINHSKSGVSILLTKGFRTGSTILSFLGVLVCLCMFFLCPLDLRYKIFYA